MCVQTTESRYPYYLPGHIRRKTKTSQTQTMRNAHTQTIASRSNIFGSTAASIYGQPQCVSLRPRCFIMNGTHKGDN